MATQASKAGTKAVGIVAITITVLVYGAVALIVKMYDVELKLGQAG